MIMKGGWLFQENSDGFHWVSGGLRGFLLKLKCFREVPGNFREYQRNFSGSLEDSKGVIHRSFATLMSLPTHYTVCK